MKIPPLLSLQLAGDLQTRVHPSCALQVLVWGELELRVETWQSQSLEDAGVTGAGSGLSDQPPPWQFQVWTWGLQLILREQDPGLTPQLGCTAWGGPWGCPPSQGPLCSQGHLGSSRSAKGKMNLGCLPETALLGHGGIKN